ncbi:hypothetical protein BDR03DRAFT_393093 [Suillus americanus]|nr:hypothetical protein BDR03DRAFT_393093 [Suillus americanus]
MSPEAVYTTAVGCSSKRVHVIWYVTAPEGGMEDWFGRHRVKGGMRLYCQRSSWGLCYRDSQDSGNYLEDCLVI